MPTIKYKEIVKVTETKTLTLKDCPFCKSSKVMLCNSHSTTYFIKCGDCQIRTDIKHDREALAVTWNNRSRAKK